jgi:hypothetical protein
MSLSASVNNNTTSFPQTSNNTTQSLNNSNMNNLQSGQSDTIADIQNLQTIENELLNQLELNLAQGNLTTDEVNSSINQINSIATMRMNLYDSLGSYNEFYQTNLQFANNTLYQQTQVLNILESKLNENRKKILALAENKNNNIRLAEINSYYGEKYKAQSRFMKIIIILIIPVLVSAILVKNNILPYEVFKFISVIVGVITFFFLINQLYFFTSRNNMQYQETNYTFNTKNVNSSSAFDASGNDASGNDVSGNDPWYIHNTSSTCQGSNCCSTGMSFDTSLNQCVDVESFENLSPANTPSLSSNKNALPLPTSENTKKENDKLTSQNLDYNSYKNSTNINQNESINWDNILASFNNLISSKKPDYTMGMESLSGYNK